MLQFHPDHPMRPVDWRWERARIIRETGKSIGARAKEDEWIRLALKFQKTLLTCQNDFDRYALLEKYPSLYFAYTLRGDDKKSGTMRSELEARLLANESQERIAERIGCNTETIKLYERLFFNISEKLKNTTYVLHQVMGPAIHKGMHEKDHDLLWKLYGYFCGTAVLDALTSTFTNPSRPETPEQVDALFVDDTRAVMRRKAAIAARTVAVNEYTQISILEIYTKFLEIEKDVTGVGGAEGLLLENIKVMLTALPWATGSDVGKRSTDKVIKFYDNQAVELRSDELIEVNAGLENENHMKLIDFKFPEAKSHA